MGSNELYSWYDSSSRKYLSFSEGVSGLPSSGFFILGETHYEQSIMNAQGAFIHEFVGAKSLRGNFSVGWEFLNFPDQGKLDASFSFYANGSLGLNELLSEFFPTSSAKHTVYAPLFEMAKKFDGRMVATNAPRDWKRVIVREGIDALSQDRIPFLMERGSSDYYNRFVAAIGGHGDPSVIENYFMAQSYTDAVMAQSLVDISGAQATIMITGHFHSDYGHGLPSYLLKGTSQNIEIIRIVDFKNLTQEEREEVIKEHPTYGAKASHFLIINK